MPTEGEAVGPIVITRLECDAHGDVLEGGNAAVRWCPDHGCHVKPVERVYWAADEVLEELRTETDFYEGKVGGSQEKQDGYALGFYEAADFLERRFGGQRRRRTDARRFSGEGAS